MPERMKVGVLFGGRSGEHAISLLSAASVIQAMDPEKYHIVPIGITEDGRWLAGGDPLRALQKKEIPGDCSFAAIITDPSSPGIMLLTNGEQQRREDPFIPLDLIFPLLHGPFGEDGTVQGLFELAGLPYVGAGVLASAVGMDKEFMKILFQHRGLNIGDYLSFQLWHWEKEEERIIREIEDKLGYPCFVKPANMGSSVGISKVSNREMLCVGVREALRYDLKIIVEANIQGREIECSVLGEEAPIASLPGEIITCNDFYDYRAKYHDDRSRLLIPAPLEEEAVKQIQSAAIESFLAVCCSGPARVDFFYQPENKRVIVNEINTLPGFTSISLYPKLWEVSGIPYPDLIDRLIEIAIRRYNRRQNIIQNAECRMQN